MLHLQLLSHAEQLAGYLKSEILKGRWSDTMPGILRLEVELGINRNTIHASLQLLEHEGILQSEGNGRARRIQLPERLSPLSLCVLIMLYEESDAATYFMSELRHAIREAGHTAEYSTKSLKALGMNPKKIAAYVSKTKADAWVIGSGSREILDWFSSQPKPAFAFFGRRRFVPLASTGLDKTVACAAAVNRLVELGHRNIVMLVRDDRRKPSPGLIEQTFLDTLSANGIRTGPYHLPDWDDNADAFYQCIDSLFIHTPPTALFVDEPSLFFAAQHHLAQRGIVAPKDISMICMDVDPGFDWYRPAISHISWDSRPLIRRVVTWANNVASGKEDRRKRDYKAEFIEGGTIGAVPDISRGLK